ncbi:MAG: PAS domain-containing protein, partial [Anaerolineae bacterium]
MGEGPSQTILELLFEVTDDAVAVKDLDGRYLLVNQAMARLCDYTVGEMVGRTVADLFPPQVAQQLAEADQRVLESGQPLTVEERFSVGDETRICLTRKIPHRNDEGEIVGLVGIGQDITEQARASEVLQERVKELDCLYGISALVEQPGISLAEILQGTADLIPPAWRYPEITAACISLEDREYRTANFQEGCPWRQVADLVVQGQRRGRVEVCYLEERPERDEGPFLAEERSLLQAVAERLGRVIERLRAERELQESEARLQVLTVGTPAYIFEVDASGTIQFVNRTYAGLTREQVVGTNLLDWLPEAQRSGIQALLEQTFASGQPQSTEYTIPDPQGELRSYAAELHPVLAGDRVSAAVLTATDISERVRAEEALQEAHKDLDRRVQERTAALVEINTILEKEIAHRSEVQAELLRANRAQQMLIQCGEAVIRATDEDALLQEICELVVGAGGYRLAWVGYALRDEARTVRPVAQAGFEEGYLGTLNITWTDSARGRGPTGTAIRTGRPAPSRNILTDPRFAPWRAEATRRGYASSLALPLKARGQTLGSLNIYAAQADAFDTQETRLLSELADNVAFGIVALRTSADRQRAEEALQRRAEELSALHDVGHRVSGSLSLEEVVQAALDGIAEAVAPDLALLYLRLGEELHLQGVHAVEDRHRDLAPEVKQVGECLCGMAVSEGRPLYSRDIVLDPLCTLQECKQAGMRSFAALPLLQGTEVFGVLGLASTAERVFAEQATFLEATVG